MKKQLIKYLNVSPREFRGFIVVLIIVLIIYITPIIYQKLTYQPLKISIEVLEPKIKEIENLDNKNNYSQKFNPEKNSEAVLFNFDPNNLPLEDWVKLGLSERQAKIIKNYESKGGKFKSKEDVKKMYSITAQQYQQLEPYIQIPDKQVYSNNQNLSKNFNSNAKPIKNVILVEINEADSITLTTVKGIGPSFASRIIKYRNRLGGYISLNQLKEVFGIDSTKFAQILPQLKLSNPTIKQININTCTFDELKNFPYLSYKQMNAIIAYRKQHGNYKSEKDLSKILIINSETIEKIKPYISF
jgi:competence ComEA-like helix-hairpin-helix protein